MKISVALCTYNGEKFLAEQLESIFAQTLPVDEIVICDDCSTDSTVAIIQRFALKFPGIIKLYINQQPVRTVKNFEKAVSLTTGDYIFLCDQDDVWFSNKVENMIGYMLKNPNTLLLFANGKLIDEEDKPLESTLWDHWGFDQTAKQLWKNHKNAFQNLLYNQNYITGATAVLNKKLRRRAIPIKIPNGYYHDTWFGLHAAAMDGLSYLDESFIKYRIHSAQQVGVIRGKANDAVIHEKDISVDSYIKKIYKQYPHLKYKESLLIQMKVFLHKLFRLQ